MVTGLIVADLVQDRPLAFSHGCDQMMTENSTCGCIRHTSAIGAFNFTIYIFRYRFNAMTL